MRNRENVGVIRGRRVVTVWIGPTGPRVDVAAAEDAGVLLLGVEFTNRVTTEDGVRSPGGYASGVELSNYLRSAKSPGDLSSWRIRSFGILPDGVALPDGWRYVESPGDRDSWQESWSGYLDECDLDVLDLDDEGLDEESLA